MKNTKKKLNSKINLDKIVKIDPIVHENLSKIAKEDKRSIKATIAIFVEERLNKEVAA